MHRQDEKRSRWAQGYQAIYSRGLFIGATSKRQVAEPVGVGEHEEDSVWVILETDEIESDTETAIRVRILQELKPLAIDPARVRPERRATMMIDPLDVTDRDCT